MSGSVVTHRLRVAGLAVTAFLLLAAPGRTQEGPVTFEFSFSNPGARSMGLGGAFAALADDATAAFANPAGLVQLLEPEVSVEGRWWSYETPYLAGGRLSGEPTGIGIDTRRGIDYRTSSEDLVGLSFISAVYPHEKWSVSVYRHVWANFELRRQIDGFFSGDDDEIERAEDLRVVTDLEVTNYGLAAAYEVTEELSLGIGAVYYEAKLDAFADEYVHTEEGFFDPNPFTPELIDTTYDTAGESSGLALHAGVLWRPSPRWSFGGHYRQGPEMTIQVLEVTGPGHDELPPGVVELDAESSLHLPDVYGVGAAFRSAGGALTVSVEWDRVLYANITEDLDDEVFDTGEIALSDGNELHLGIEYVLAGVKPILAFRVGAWRDPAHSLGSGPEADEFEQAAFTGGEDEIHWTAGMGMVVGKLQLDLGADVSDAQRLVSLSAVYRF